ncbi:dapper homolog 3-like [Nycticebus coucang]|uniref:dapper homolog 3-like n=1 Tax=Nycticebus coucang TaxID=9470 RepID=UPI00234D6C4D|nr:dapper homolog 3-like [Nycticebus coucang]
MVTVAPATPLPSVPTTRLKPGERYNRSPRRGDAGWPRPRVLRIDFAKREGAGARSPSERGSPPAPPGRARQPSPDRAAAHSTSTSTPGREAQSKQVSEAGTEAHCSLPRLLPPSASAPPERPSGTGTARGEALRAAATPAGEGRSGSLGAGSAQKAAPRLSGRTRRRGSPAGRGAAALRVLLLGRCRLQPSSQRRAAPGVKSTFSRSFPHAAPPARASAHTPRPHAPSGKKIREREREERRRQKLDRGAQTWKSLRAAAAGGAEGSAAARGQLSSWRAAPRPAPARLASLAQTGSLEREAAATPPHISDLPAQPERWPLPHERMKARTRARGRGEEAGRATPRTAAAGSCPPTSPRNSPVAKKSKLIFHESTNSRKHLTKPIFNQCSVKP